MQLIYLGHTDEVYVPAADVFAAFCQVVEIPDPIAKSLIEQDCWSPAPSEPPTLPFPKTKP